MKRNELQINNTAKNANSPEYQIEGAALTHGVEELRLSAFIEGGILGTVATPLPKKLGVVINIGKNVAEVIRGSPE